MRETLRRRYGHGAARIPFAGSAPRWSTGGNLGQALRPVIVALLGCAAMLLTLPWLLPSRESDDYAPLEFAFEVVPPQQVPVPAREPDVTPPPASAQPPPEVFQRLPDRPVLPHIASVETLPEVPDVPRIRARRADHAPKLGHASARRGHASVRNDVGFASSPTPALAPVSAPPAEQAYRLRAQQGGSEPGFVREPLPSPGPAAQGSAAPEDVPLGRLAPCASRAEEDHLKQRVIASANARGTCQSDAGSYRFVENRNLNAFLLRIRRNPDREVANRCEELEFALECLAQRSKEPSKS